jgi:PhnB protein
MSSPAIDTTARKAPSANDAPVKGGVVPYLQLGGASDAAEFYGRAFGATEVFRYPVDQSGRTMHIHLHINGSSVMLSDAYPEHGYALEKPQGFNLTLQVDDIDSWFARAVAAGAEVTMPVQEMFWGARYCQLKDRFGVHWSMNQPL